MEAEAITFRCRATVSSWFLNWPLAQATLTGDALTLDVPGIVGRGLRHLGLRLPVTIAFQDVISVRESRDSALQFRFTGERELRELRAERRIDVWASFEDREVVKASLRKAGIEVPRTEHSGTAV